MEIWKDIKGYEGLYQVSTHGNVKALGNGGSKSKEKVLKPYKNHKGYMQVGLCKQGKRKQYFVHRLVAQNFIENPNNYPMINHRNELKTDNRVENLEFCDALYNNNYGTHTEKVAESNTNNSKLSKPVMCVETGIIYPSANEAARQLGFLQCAISNTCNGKRKTYKGYTWRYIF